MKRFRVSTYKPTQSPIYDFALEEHLNTHENQDGQKSRLAQILPYEGGFLVVWETGPKDDMYDFGPR